MTKIKLCGLKRPCDIEYVNELNPEYIGFVFVKKSKRYISPKEAEALRKQLNEKIIPVGVFVDEDIDIIADLIRSNVICAVQLHGSESEDYIKALKEEMTGKTIIKAFQIKNREDVKLANKSLADYVLLDSGCGSGETFDWSLISEITRPYFLAGGLTLENVKIAIEELNPFAVDASSSLETDGFKDKEKMTAFVNVVRQRKD